MILSSILYNLQDKNLKNTTFSEILKLSTISWFYATIPKILKGQTIQTITITASKPTIDKIKEILKSDKDAKFIDDYISRFDEYKDDIKAYYNGTLKTYTQDELDKELSKW